MKTEDRDIMTVEKLSENIERTREGYLLCRGVQIARAGALFYQANEIPKLKAGDNGLLMVSRSIEDLAEAVASFEGKPVTMMHPKNWVGPDNHKELVAGVAMNVRIDGQFMLADLLITDADAIQRVMSKELRDISLGYDALYEQETPGLARQFNISGNHIALVDRGRNGPTCRIEDRAMEKKPSLFDRIRGAFQTRDEAALNEALSDTEKELSDKTATVNLVVTTEPPKATADNDDKDDKKAEETKDDPLTAIMEMLKAMEARLAKLETKDSEPPKEDEKKTTDEDDDKDDKETKTQDSAAALADVARRAEIIIPGIALPDAKTPLHDFQKSVLAKVANEDRFKGLVNARTVDRLSPVEANAVFIAASEIARVKNNAGVITATVKFAPKTGGMTVAEEQAKLDAFWKQPK